MRWIHLYTFICVTSVKLLSISTALDTYIVHVKSPDQISQNEDLDNWYKSFLPENKSPPVDGVESSHIVHSYHHVFKGFSARLLPEDLKAMEKKSGFILATPDEILPLHTTHTPSFLGLHQNMGFWNQSNYGKGVIIGLLDTGITPDHPSFSDKGVPPPPPRWKGKCDGKPSACNNKLIGARSLINGSNWAADEEGHGTHTSSTVAGNFVKGANLFGSANGTAAGIASLAHLAMYKVCDLRGGCSTSAILAGMDAAIDDGVDVLSISLGGTSIPYHIDQIAIGAYSATKKGIFVSCSAGNNGPAFQTTSNDAPWILTVGASTTDRKLKSTVVLGNNKELDGESLLQPKDFPVSQFPLHYPGLNYSTDPKADLYCSSDVVDQRWKGKIVVCQDGLNGLISAADQSANVKNAGGIGIIVLSTVEAGHTYQVQPVIFPYILLSSDDGLKIIRYINTTKSPTSAILFKGTVIGDTHAPEVASFSSRGPSLVNPGILKPDILGPGHNILAAWPESVPIAPNVSMTTMWNVLWGTSMACPHLSGVAALLRNEHPDWSPAAIKSAILTTVGGDNLSKKPIEDERQHQASIFATGSGHVNPSKANNPGLIYDINPEDYIPFLCGLNYTNQQVSLIVQGKVNCTRESGIVQTQLNYPSFVIRFREGSVQKYTRTVTNVGEANSIYKVEVVAPENVNITVNPRTLNFSEMNNKLTYNVTFTISSSASSMTSLGNLAGGSITWSSNKHTVRSPVVAINL